VRSVCLDGPTGSLEAPARFLRNLIFLNGQQYETVVIKISLPYFISLNSILNE